MSSIYPSYGSAPTQLCQRCGRPLPPNEVYCSNCGLVNTPSQPNSAPTQLPSGISWGSTPPGTAQPGGQPWRQSPAQPSPPPSASGFQTSGYAQPPAMDGYQQPGFANPPAMNGYQSGGFAPQAEERSRRPKIGMILTIVVILLVVVGGSIGGFTYLKKHSASTTTQVSPTVAPAPIPQGKPLFSDPFQNNNAGWDLTSKPGEFSIKISNGSMVLEDDNNKLFSELIPGGRNFNDFFFTVDATLSKGTQSNGYGIYFRGASNQLFDIATYYRFELYGDGTFAIYKGSVDGTGTSTSTFLVNYSQSPALQKQGNVNHIGISAKGPTMTFVVNGQTLKIVTDNTYSSGSIALFVSNLPHTTPGAQATFSNLVIYPPQS
jgi:predicted nucleic acid-binding Zn ribbon protein